ncbi:MAG: hypothetical protein ACTSSE_00460 [Candidatus Thorarchaeota archaeon]
MDWRDIVIIILIIILVFFILECQGITNFVDFIPSVGGLPP